MVLFSADFYTSRLTRCYGHYKQRRRRFLARRRLPRIRARLEAAAELHAVEAVLAAGSVSLQRMVLRRRDDGDELDLLFPRGADPSAIAHLADALRALPGLQSVEVRR